MSAKKLEKNLTTRSIFAFGIAGMVASGLFLLPGLVYEKVGMYAHWVYIAAGVMIIPTLFSKAELATAMPKSGGAYYVLDRSLGPAVGTVAGLGTWLSLVFKSSFDLIGLGAYILLFFVFPIKPVAIGLCIGFGILSLVSTKGVGRMQVWMVAALLVGLAYFVITGILNFEQSTATMTKSWDTTSFLEAIGMIYVSFASLIKILSMAEEVKNQEQSIPNGIFASAFVTIIIYVAGMALIMNWVPPQTLSGSLTPVADAAGQILGEPGIMIFSALAVLAFSASANAGLTAATRYPFALSRDKLLPPYFSKLSKFNTPTYSIISTVLLMILFVLILSPEGVAKMASTFILIIFGMLNFAVIVMRESRILSYDPGFKSPAYPWMQIFGLLSSLILIPFLGVVPRVAAGVLVGLGLMWYFVYGKKRREGSSALLHIFSEFGDTAANNEVKKALRQNMRERGLRSHDTLDDILYRAPILRHEDHTSFRDILDEVGEHLADRLEVPAEEIAEELQKVDDQGKTPVRNHIALPHIYLSHTDHHELAIIQSPSGIQFDSEDEQVYALFILIGPEDEPRQHLRLLAEIANRTEQIDVEGEWREWSLSRIREEFLDADHVREITISHPHLQDQPIENLWINPNCLIAFIERNGKMIIPHQDLKIQQGDHLVIIGSESAIEETSEWLNNPLYEMEPVPPQV